MLCELKEYPQVTDGKQSCKAYQSWAKREWGRVQAEAGEPFSHDYGSGFLQGFVDQVKSGGEPIAPPVPPRKYWRVGYRNQQGRQAVEQWYNGFEHGATVADEGGYRDRAVVPSSLYAGTTTESETSRVESVDPSPMEPTPAVRPSQLELPVTSKPVKTADLAKDEAKPETQADKPAESEPVIEVADASGTSAAAAPSHPEAVSAEPPRSVLPVVFVRPDSEPRQIQPAWGDTPPAPPWHADAQPTSPTPPGEASDEFDPYVGSIVAGPSEETSDRSDVNARSSKPKSPAKSSVNKSDDAQDDLPEQAFTEKKVDEQSTEPSGPAEPTPASQDHPAEKDEDTQDEDTQDEDHGDEGWQQSKHEPTKWKSRR